MNEPRNRGPLLATINQIITTGLWVLVGLGWGLELLSYRTTRPGEFHEAYGWAIGFLLFPFALTFQIAAIGWRQQTRWRWIAQLTPLGAILFMKWWL